MATGSHGLAAAAATRSLLGSTATLHAMLKQVLGNLGLYNFCFRLMTIPVYHVYVCSSLQPLIDDAASATLI